MGSTPWTPSQAFPHPLSSRETASPSTNLQPSDLIMMMKYHDLGDTINEFRTEVLGLKTIDLVFTRGADVVKKQLVAPFSYSWYEIN